MAKIVSLVVKIGAVVFILAIPQAYAIQLQLLGGIWIIQLLPPILLGLYSRGFNALALLIGWAVGTAIGTYYGGDARLRLLGLSARDPSALPFLATRRSIRWWSTCCSPSCCRPLFDLVARRTAAPSAR